MDQSTAIHRNDGYGPTLADIQAHLGKLMVEQGVNLKMADRDI